ncbi:MAG: phage holin family protein, partial [Propionibacterium sp.]|nr:phage holin family protein [Propionibacterium sp.]
MADNLTTIKEQLSDFISKETELAKAEIVPSAKKALWGTVLGVVALAFALHAVWMLVIALAAVFTWLISLTGLSVPLSLVFGFLIAMVVSLIIGAVFGFLAYRKFKKVKAP